MQKSIETERLRLRAFVIDDAPKVAELAGNKMIAEMTANIPHPYTVSDAMTWIDSHSALFNQKKAVVYAVTLKETSEVIGTVSFPTLRDGLGVLGYWFGIDFWGNGYATEASNALIAFGQKHLGLWRLQVMHLVENDRSRSVIEKLGVQYVENRVNRMQGQDREVCVYESDIENLTLSDMRSEC
ncbi:GNAT family N-acetyltransferase [Enterovibrio calviensis]|uniref:GNAT family N-acetyltransferase n=1 Tax=Enterovibrio calviensis TaxID=91359 RepID=UPI000684F11B|nr:GNAT family N-acetyltransferase [Enterovibrio calviensis]